MIAWVGKQMIYDGPSQYWHAMFPVLKFTISPWPWSYLGKAPIWDLLPLQDSLNSVLRVIDDHVAQVANPGSILDLSLIHILLLVILVSSNLFEKATTFGARLRKPTSA